MGKLIFWIVIVFGLLLVSRLANAAAAKRRNADRTGTAGNAAASPMVRCVRCGVFLPRSEATPVQGGHACADPGCAERR